MTSKKDYAPKQRFSHTVENYVKYRPHYPKKVLDILKEQCGLNKQSVIADIGSGTGIFSKLLLEDGNSVLGVEPNSEMRQAAEHYLSAYDTFTSVNASAEHTTLDDHSIDIITAAQAFHWFDQNKVKQEFSRLLKPNGFLVLLWNLRDFNQPGIMQAHEALLQKFGIDYKEVCAEGLSTASIRQFFVPHPVEIVLLPNQQILDWEAFKGRLLSTSYVPKPEDPNFNKMLDAAKIIFDQYQHQGTLTFVYETKVYIGSLSHL